MEQSLHDFRLGVISKNQLVLAHIPFDVSALFHTKEVQKLQEEQNVSKSIEFLENVQYSHQTQKLPCLGPY